MFVDLDFSDSSVVLCGAPERTSRVALKYGKCSQVQQVHRPEELSQVQGAPSCAVLCVDSDSDDARAWKESVKRALPGVLILIDDEKPADIKGEVFLIGAGPGDSGLLTRHALKALAQSDVVLLDHLAPRKDVESWSPHATIIDVGKVPGKHRVPQSEIDALMLTYARQGKKVARLKGGDPYVFGRGAEEFFICQEAEIPVTVYSGVTSSIAVPALAGVPLTLRGVSHMFTVVSAHNPLSDSELEHLAHFLADGGTISILMGTKTLPHTVAGLIANGVTKQMPVVVVHDGFRQSQCEYFSTLGDCRELFGVIKPPSVITVGRVCALAGERRQEIMAEAFKTH